MKPYFKWEGSQDEDSGEAIYGLEGRKIQVRLDSFGDAHRLSELIDSVYAEGIRDGRSRLIAQIERCYDE